MEQFITPHFCETMYCHYDAQLQRRDIPIMARRLMEQCQQSYLEMHEMLVSFQEIAKGLPIEFINK